MPYRKQVGICALAAFAIAMGSSFAVQSLKEFWPENMANEKISPTPPERRSLHTRGYLATYALELATGYPWRMKNHTQPLESPEGIESLPSLSCTDKIALIQVEALDYEMVTEKAQGEYVMPFLHGLLKHAILLRLDGTKKMASANSDYEIFNGRIASHSILHYEYEQDYSESFLRFLTQKISPSYSFHGVPGNYMNQEVAYQRQGVQHVYGLEKMQAEGVPAIPIWTDGIASDTDLLAFAAQKIPAAGPFLHFIITLDMHVMDQPEMVCNSLKFPDEPRNTYYSLCRHTDTALAAYIEQLPAGTTVAIWGDHRSYTSEASGYIPFLFFITGQSHPFAHEDAPLLNRSKIYYYLKKNFSQLGAQQVPATAESGR
ncbi:MULTISPECIES: sulfatase-like hydrolase/transferase [unclassified Desulfovibrio]|uniref:sulfatase-like hydrolase/transferase n=1 Tax=unclassified Desulfovibrio TaxID=2593640 RepID=UPI002FDB63D9